MQSQWLYQHIQAENQQFKRKWDPNFSLPSTLNWMQSLSLEITQSHGSSPIAQFISCQSQFASTLRPLENSASLPSIFGSLFHSLTFASTLTSMVEAQPCRPWTFPTAIVAWYYATYNAFRAIVGVSGNFPPETHAGLQRCLYGSQIRPKLPHPFNMVAKYQNNEDYTLELPNYPGVEPADLAATFLQTQQQTQGMLLSYLKETVAWEVDKHKDNLRKDRKITGFRKKVDREARNQRLQNRLSEVNFLHCAFRYRGKANYRDSIFLAYGQEDSRISLAFMEALESAAKFAFLCGLAYAECRIGKSYSQAFLSDVSHHFRGQSQATPQEKIWEVLLSQY